MPTLLAGYRLLDRLHESANSLVYRARREHDQQPAILKTLKDPYPPPETIAWFQREYALTRRVRDNVPGVVAALALTTDQNRWVMVLEDFGGDSLARLGLAGKMALADFLALALQVAEILGQIHRQHIMHKDLNPSNVVFNPTTGQVKLIDFGISTALSRETPTFRNPNVLEGTLAYLSPEQTGRMNRALDYRTDFYSLGATFYELLTGQPPFTTDDALELLHCHIARPPAPPANVPAGLAALVLKLLAKNAEDRYQSAHGLKADLEECARQWQATQQIEAFPLGQWDVSEQLQIPQKLYGREAEVAALLEAFERVGTGAGELMLVAGYSGIGKSALVQEVHKPITQRRGYFSAGKYDQFQRNQPYSALIEAFRALLRQVLTESEAALAEWRKRLQTALGPNGRIIAEVLAEVELIIGPQPPLPALGPVEAQNRFGLVFQNFIRVFARPAHPLVIFLDDLQWADGASLTLLRRLLTAGENQGLFVVGAYRDNEVHAAHPLLALVEDIENNGTVAVGRLGLTPLTLAHIARWLADALRCTPDRALPLAELLLAKTGGNPFFLGEFLKALYVDGLITFDAAQGAWQWNAGQVQTQGITDNVVELLAGKVQQLGEATQQALKLAACIGNHFDLETLALVLAQPPRATAAALWEALAEGLVLPLSEAYKLIDLPGLDTLPGVEYKFAHDRVQQAVYSLIPEAERAAAHGRIGRLLLEQLSPEAQEQRLFDVVQHLNLGSRLLTTPAEREALAALNLRVGHKAKASAAYQPAFNYLQAGLALLPADSWTQHYDLTLALHGAAAEAAYLSGNFETMEALTASVLQHARTVPDKVLAADVRIQASLAQNKFQAAIQEGLRLLHSFGVHFPAKPTLLHTLRALVETRLVLRGKSLDALAAQPAMTAPDKIAIFQLIARISSAAYLGQIELFPLLVLRQVIFSVRYGNVPLSCGSYAAYGIILCGALGEIETGFAYGQLALRLLDQLDAKAFRARTYMTVHSFVHHWRAPAEETLAPLKAGHTLGLETGDLEFAAYCANMYAAHTLLIGAQELAGLEREMAAYAEVQARTKQATSRDYMLLYQQIALNLLGTSETPWRLQGEVYHAAEMWPQQLATNNLNHLYFACFYQLWLGTLFEQYAEALEKAAPAEKYKAGAVGFLVSAFFPYYDSLARLGLYPTRPPAEQKRLLGQVAANQKQLHTWAKFAPANHLHHWHLVAAERARVLGQPTAARDHYDRAIALARAHNRLNDEALALELAGRFHHARDLPHLADFYLCEAHYAYQRWGARAKVKALQARYPQLLIQTATGTTKPTTHRTTGGKTTTTGGRGPHVTGRSTVSALDFASVLKASQAIAGEIVLDRLLADLMRIVIENAGAQLGYLLLEDQGTWVIQAEATIGQDAVRVLQAVPVEQAVNLPRTLIHYVARVKETVVLADAAKEGDFTRDPDLAARQPLSVLCLPLLKQGQLAGLVYLENNLTRGAFTPERLEALNTLAAQAATALENARLYANLSALNQAYERFVPREFLRFLNRESITAVTLGDQTLKEMTVLFADVRSFTTLSEGMTPKENFDFINTLLGGVGPVIRQNGGFIDKYLGDGIMALFPDKADDAVRAGIAVHRQLAHYNAARTTRAVQIGVGVHWGTLMLGVIGETERMEGTVIADAVNLAARLEGLTRFYDAALIVSEQTLKQLADPTAYDYRPLGKVQVKGKAQVVLIFEVFDGDPEAQRRLKRETLPDFQDGLFQYLDCAFPEAAACFARVLAANPTDRAAQLYFQRATEFAQHGVPEGWNGVELLETK